MHVLVVDAEVGAVVELRPLALEGVFRDEIDAAAERVGRDVGRRHLDHLGAGGVVNRDLLELEDAVVGAGSRTGEAHAVPVDVGEVRGEAADRDGADVGRHIVNREAGEVLEELAGVALIDVAERVGRHDDLHVGRVALLVHRDGVALVLAVALHHEGVELEGLFLVLAVALAAGEVEIKRGGLAGRDGDRDGLRIQPGEESLYLGLARGDVAQAVFAELIGEGLAAGAGDGDAGVVQVFPVADVLHPALDAARRSGLGEQGGGGGEAGGQCQGAEQTAGGPAVEVNGSLAAESSQSLPAGGGVFHG